MRRKKQTAVSPSKVSSVSARRGLTDVRTLNIPSSSSNSPLLRMREAVDLTSSSASEGFTVGPSTRKRRKALGVIDLSCLEPSQTELSRHSSHVMIDMTSESNELGSLLCLEEQSTELTSTVTNEVVHPPVEVIDDERESTSPSAITSIPITLASPSKRLPLSSKSVEIDLTAPDQCRICYDEVNADEAGFCPRHHALCLGCFEGYICSANAPGSINYVDEAGRLLCFVCHIAYDPRALTGASKSRLYDMLQELRITKVKERELKIELEKQEARLRSEFEQTLAKSGEDREAHLLIRKIRNEVLNLRCPACGAVFVDFEGCYALKCAVTSCRRAFCAWCLADCGKDAHHHVAKCPEGSGTVWGGDLKTFNAHHNKRRAARVKALLRDENKAIQRKVLDGLKTELRDLGIKIKKVV